MTKNIYEIDPAKPFSHFGRNGTELKATMMALDKGVNVLHRPALISDEMFAADIACIIAWWAMNILSNYPPGYGFSGVDNIRFEIKSKAIEAHL